MLAAGMVAAAAATTRRWRPRKANRAGSDVRAGVIGCAALARSMAGDRSGDRAGVRTGRAAADLLREDEPGVLVELNSAPPGVRAVTLGVRVAAGSHRTWRVDSPGVATVASESSEAALRRPVLRCTEAATVVATDARVPLSRSMFSNNESASACARPRLTEEPLLGV